MQQYSPYSPYFKTLHDEAKPTVCYLGRGSHYSILRALTWQDARCRPLIEASLQDFAIIWDEDHDTRIINVIMHLYQKGLFAPVLFIGERKAQLTILTDGEMPQSYLAECDEAVRRVTENEGDPWARRIASFSSNDMNIIAAKVEDVRLYLDAIKMLWQLGQKVSETQPEDLLAHEPPQQSKKELTKNIRQPL